MIVGVCGYGYTGSGAALDLLREYDECCVAKEIEFELLYSPGGIYNLDLYLNECCSKFNSSDLALRSFRHLIDKNKRPGSQYYDFTNGAFVPLSLKYFDNICMCKWRGNVYYDRYVESSFSMRWRVSIKRRFLNLLGKKVCAALHYDYGRDMFFSLHPDNFCDTTKEYIASLLEAAGYDSNKTAVVNQAFPSNNIIRGMKYFDNPKAIVVDRDPRDLLLFCRNVVRSQASFLPLDSIQDYIRYYKAIRESHETDSRILHINFEDLVFDYDDTVLKIEEFLNIRRHIEKFRHFNPNVSAANTRLFMNPKFYNNQSKDDIRMIEAQLSEYLYCYHDNAADISGADPFDK